MRTSFLVIILVIIALLSVACGGGQAPIVMDEPVPAGAEGAKVVELTFSSVEIVPEKVALKAGEKVLFVIKNTDKQDDHNLVGTDIGIKEILVKPGQTVRRLWTVPSKTGEFPSGCTIHPEIRMKFNIQ